MRYCFHWGHRLAAWEAAHPQYSADLTAFTETFLKDPSDPSLERTPSYGSDLKPRANVWHYKIPGVPIPLVIEVENAEHVRSEIDMWDEPPDPDSDKPDDGERWAKILWPRSPNDVIPDDEMG